MDPALGYTEACSSSAAAGLPLGRSTAAAEEGSLVGVDVDSSNGLRTLVLSGAGEGEEDAAVLDLTLEVRDI